MTEDGLFVCQSLAMNIWDDEWGEQGEDWSGGGGRSKRLVGSGPLLVLVGERQLDEGAVVHFPTGADGAHEIRNDTDEPVRYVVAGTRVSPEVVEYPDLKQLNAQSKHGLFAIHDVKEEA
jgi:hypothetical protein